MNHCTNIFIYVAAADLNMDSLLRFTAKDLRTISAKPPEVIVGSLTRKIIIIK